MTDMTRQEIKAKSQSRSAPIIEQIKQLSKEELVELITGNWHVAHYLAERHITDAKAAVLRKKAEAAWKEYGAFQLPDMPDDPSLEQYFGWLKRIAEKEALYKKYEKLWKRADKIEFGR